jgi:hypothetical protein
MMKERLAMKSIKHKTLSLSQQYLGKKLFPKEPPFLNGLLTGEGKVPTSYVLQQRLGLIMFGRRVH